MIVSFNGYIPVPRYDSLPWTSVVIQEAPAETGPWTTIDTIAISPVDPNPAEPNPRNFTTDNATLDAGWYKIIFKDAAGDELPTNPIQNVPEARPEFWPDVDTIGAMLRARTVDDQGRELGTFTGTTRPTAIQTEEMIGVGARDLATLVGSDIPDTLIPDAKRLAALRTAMLIELSYFPEQVSSNRSAYAQYRELWLEAVGTPNSPGWFVIAVRDAETDEDPTADVSNMPRFSFPDGVMVGWGSRW